MEQDKGSPPDKAETDRLGDDSDEAAAMEQAQAEAAEERETARGYQ